MQDNDPKHTSDSTSEWLKKKLIKVLESSGKEEWASDMKGSLAVITNAWLQLLLPPRHNQLLDLRSARQVYSFFPLINEIIISKLHFVFTRVIFM